MFSLPRDTYVFFHTSITVPIFLNFPTFNCHTYRNKSIPTQKNGKINSRSYTFIRNGRVILMNDFQIQLLKLSAGVIQLIPVLIVHKEMVHPGVMEIASGQMHWSNVLTEVCSAYAFLDNELSSLSLVFLFRHRCCLVISPIVI